MVGPQIFKGIVADMDRPQPAQRAHREHRANGFVDIGERAVEPGEREAPGGRGRGHGAGLYESRNKNTRLAGLFSGPSLSDNSPYRSAKGRTGLPAHRRRCGTQTVGARQDPHVADEATDLNYAF